MKHIKICRARVGDKVFIATGKDTTKSTAVIDGTALYTIAAMSLQEHYGTQTSIAPSAYDYDEKAVGCLHGVRGFRYYLVAENGMLHRFPNMRTRCEIWAKQEDTRSARLHEFKMQPGEYPSMRLGIFTPQSFPQSKGGNTLLIETGAAAEARRSSGAVLHGAGGGGGSNGIPHGAGAGAAGGNGGPLGSSVQVHEELQRVTELYGCPGLQISSKYAPPLQDFLRPGVLLKAEPPPAPTPPWKHKVAGERYVRVYLPTQGEAHLDLAALRQANRARLPQFKNAHGQPAHSKPDGSDWCPAQWLQAVTGELGEYSNWRKKYERGDIDRAEFAKHAAKELADVATYLDILAMRCLDTPSGAVDGVGIDLGKAVQDKFNEVSCRVGSSVRLQGTAAYTYQKRLPDWADQGCIGRTQVFMNGIREDHYHALRATMHYRGSEEIEPLFKILPKYGTGPELVQTAQRVAYSENGKDFFDYSGQRL
jgi:NTP pyrophosphatase (non-canonical NTP hydrolase)